MSDDNTHLQNAAQSLNDQMRCGLLASPNGDIMIVHDQRLPSDLEWIEYNQKDNRLFLINDEGHPMDLGLNIDEAMKKNLCHGVEVILAQISDTKIVAKQKVSIVIQDY